MIKHAPTDHLNSSGLFHILNTLIHCGPILNICFQQTQIVKHSVSDSKKELHRDVKQWTTCCATTGQMFQYVLCESYVTAFQLKYRANDQLARYLSTAGVLVQIHMELVFCQKTPAFQLGSQSDNQKTPAFQLGSSLDVQSWSSDVDSACTAGHVLVCIPIDNHRVAVIQSFADQYCPRMTIHRTSSLIDMLNILRTNTDVSAVSKSWTALTFDELFVGRCCHVSDIRCIVQTIDTVSNIASHVRSMVNQAFDSLVNIPKGFYSIRCAYF